MKPKQTEVGVGTTEYWGGEFVIPRASMLQSQEPARKNNDKRDE